jgi:hypothetical protein
VSHLKEREEKICLNCHAVVYGKYCHVCGQENIEPKETFWGLVTHFVYDITHFDGKFFSSLKYLLSKPGFLSKEYSKGRRASYLHPIRMYVFTSAFFFIYFFSMVKDKESDFNVTIKGNVADVKQEIDSTLKVLKATAFNPGAVGLPKNIVDNRIAEYEADLKRLETDTTKLDELNYFKNRGNLFGANKYRSTADYIKVQEATIASKRDVWIIRQLRIRELEMRQKYGNDTSVLLSKLLDKFYHQFPQILFLSLPIFAFLLNLMYLRHRQQFYYADHAIYAVHLYIAMFILLFFQLITRAWSSIPYLGWLDFISSISVLYMLYYQYKSMRIFYGQSRIKTILKYLLLLITMVVVFGILFVIFFLLSIFMV